MNSLYDQIELPLVSAIIPSKDRFPSVVSLVADLCRQDYPSDKLQILVIDDGSTPPYSFHNENASVIRHKIPQGAQKSRNEGLRAAAGEVALIIDDDIELVGPDFIRRAVTVFQRYPRVAAVVGRKYDLIENTPDDRTREFSTSRTTWYSGDLVKSEDTAGPIRWGHGIYFVRRRLLLEMGGYDGIYGLNGGHSFREESDVHARLRRLGFIIWFLPNIAVKHHIVSSGGHGPNIRRRLYWIAHNHIVFSRRYLRCWTLRALGFLLDIIRYSWVQGHGRYLFSMFRGYLAGWRNALRDHGPGQNPWLERSP